MIKAIFIDIDNTLLDFDEYVKRTLKKGFEEFNIIKYEPYMYDVFTKTNDELWKKIERGELTFEGLKLIRFNLVFKNLGVNFDGVQFEKFFRKELDTSAIKIDGAEEMLKELSKKYILCAASNGPYDQQVNRLKIAGFDKYIKYFFISSKFGYSKPKLEFYDSAFKELNLNRKEEILPSETLMLGDSLTSDILGGINYHMLTCLYNHRKNIVLDERINIKVDNLKDVVSKIYELDK